MNVELVARPLEIRTERLRLRPLRPSDAGLIGLYVSDERVARMTTRVPHPYPPGAAEEFVNRAAGATDEQVFAMDASESGLGEVLGLVSLKIRPDNAAELGYTVAPAFWNAGFASEAVAGVVEFARSSGLDALEATVFQDNPASAAVLAKAGFAYIGDDEAYSVARRAMVARWCYRLRFRDD